MALTMRELNGGDLFTIMSLLGKLDIADDLAGITNAGDGGAGIGIKIINNILKNIKNVEGDVNAILADLTSEKVKVIESLSLKDYTGLLFDFFKKEELKDFMESIGKLLPAQIENMK